MKRAQTQILFGGPDGWRVNGSDVVSADAPRAEVVAAIASATAAAGGRAEVIIAIDSAWTLSSTIALAGLPRKDRRQAMKYRLEEHFPLAAEDVAIDFIEGADGALGIAALVAPIADVVAELEASNVEVLAICPAALVAAQAMTGLDAFDLHICRHPRGIDLVWCAAGRISDWHALARSGLGDAERHLAAARDPTATRMSVQTCGCSDSDIAAIRQWPGVSAVRAGAHETTDAAVAALVARGGTPLVDLRRDGLAPADPIRSLRSPMRGAFVGLLVFLLALCGAALLKAQQAFTRLQTAQEAQEAVYRGLYPTAAIPPSIRSRLESDERRLSAAVTPPSAASSGTASGLLIDCLARLPSEPRYRIDLISVTGETLRLEGEAVSTDGVDFIATALKSGKGESLALDTPRQEKRKDGSAGFTISARPQTKGPGVAGRANR